MEQHHKDPITKKTVDEDVVGGTDLVEATASHGVSVKTLERAGSGETKQSSGMF